MVVGGPQRRWAQRCAPLTPPSPPRGGGCGGRAPAVLPAAFRGVPGRAPPPGLRTSGRGAPRSRRTTSPSADLPGMLPPHPFKKIPSGFTEGAVPRHLRGSGGAGPWGKRTVLFLIPRRGKRGCGAATGILLCRCIDGDTHTHPHP